MRDPTITSYHQGFLWMLSKKKELSEESNVEFEAIKPRKSYEIEDFSDDITTVEISNNSSIEKLAKEKIITNNVLVLEINTMGLLKKKEFLNLSNMQDVDFAKEITSTTYTKNTFVYQFLSSMRQKINDPLGKRKK